MLDEATWLRGFCVGFLVLIAMSAYEVLKNAVNSSRDNANPFIQLPPRNTTSFASMHLRSQLVLVTLIVAFVITADPSPADFGFSDLGHYWPLAFVAGVAIYFAFVLVYGLIIRWLGLYIEFSAAAYVGMRTLWPRLAVEQRKLYLGLAINPFTEELLFRGFLVYFMGKVSGSPVGFFFIGLVACLCVHAYQGARVLWFHAAFFAVAVALLYSPLGIVGVFGCHFAGDFYPLRMMPAQLGAYRKMRRLHRPLAPG